MEALKSKDTEGKIIELAGPKVYTCGALGAEALLLCHCSGPENVMMASDSCSSVPCRRKQLLELVYETIREKYAGIAAPLLLMKLAAKPREWMLKRVRGLPAHDLVRCDYFVATPSSLCPLIDGGMLQGITLPIPTIFTEDYLEESVHDLVLKPAPGVLTFADLGIQPQPVDVGLPIEHVRHYRVGGGLCAARCAC